MYASTVTYRLEMSWADRQGRRHPLEPPAVAGNVSFDSTAPFLTGSERFRTVPQIDALRRHLRDVARAACRGLPATSVEIGLDEVDDAACAPSAEVLLGAPVRTVESVACASAD
jgi:hypothetical protein